MKTVKKATIIHLIVDRKEKMIWFHVFSTVIILFAIVMKISETDYPQEKEESREWTKYMGWTGRMNKPETVL